MAQMFAMVCNEHQRMPITTLLAPQRSSPPMKSILDACRATKPSDLCRTPYTAAAHRCRGYLHCRPCGRNRRRRAPCTAPAGTLGTRAMYPGGFHRPHYAATVAKLDPRAMYLLRQQNSALGSFHRPPCAAMSAGLGSRATNHSDLCPTPYTAAAHRCRGYLHCRPCGRNRRRRALHRSGRNTRPTSHVPRRLSSPPLRRYGSETRPLRHVPATAAKLGPRAMYLLRQQNSALAPCTCYGGKTRPSRHVPAPAAKPGPRAIYLGGFHRPYCAAPAAKPGPRAIHFRDLGQRPFSALGS